MNNKRWQNLAFGLAFILPVVGAYISNRLISQYRNRSQGTQPELTRIRVPLASLIGLNADTVEPQPKPDLIVLPSATEIELEQNEFTPEEDSARVQFIASSERGKFHRPECRFALNIKPENSLLFESKDTALAQGLTPCSTCNP